MQRLVLVFLTLAWLGSALTASAASASKPEAILVVAADQHSAYERVAQFVARIDELKKENANVPLAILINGDSLEYGNVVGRRSGGALDFEMFRLLAERAPTILNLGNHEADFHAAPDAVLRLQAAGVTVISANARSRESDEPLAPASTRLKLGQHDALVVGLMTDSLNTFRAAVRPTLDLRDPVGWAREHLAETLRGESLPILLTHTGLRVDREILPLLPDGTLFAGAHDHLRFIHHEGRTVYFHSGSWMEFISIARLQRGSDRVLRWEVEHVPLRETDPAEPSFAALISETMAQHLTAEELAIVGRTAHSLAPSQAARFAVDAARQAAAADVAIIGGTTFGAGLPAGEVTRFAFDACVRFDGTLWTARIDGARLKRMLAKTNQGPATPFEARAGDNLVSAAPDEIHDDQQYRLVTTDWIGRNPANYLGEDAPAFTEQKDLTLKAAVLAALQ